MQQTNECTDSRHNPTVRRNQDDNLPRLLLLVVLLALPGQKRRGFVYYSTRAESEMSDERREGWRLKKLGPIKVVRNLVILVLQPLRSSRALIIDPRGFAMTPSDDAVLFDAAS